jgi:hypothetical protein
MKTDAGSLLVLAHGIAGRLRVNSKHVFINYSPSTYLRAPAGIEDDSARMFAKVAPHPENPRASISWEYLRDMDVSDVADKFAELLNQIIKPVS